MKAFISHRKVISCTTPVSLIWNRFHCSQTSNQNNDTTVQQITTILKQKNWKFLLDSSHVAQTLNPDVIRSVLHQYKSIDSKRLLSFFNWSTSQMGTPQNLSSFSILAIVLCNSNQFAHAHVVLEKMIETRSPDPLVVDSIFSCYRDCEVSARNQEVLNILINVYKRRGKLDEAASVLVAAKNGKFLPSLVCLNTLLKDLLKCGKMDLFWRVFDAMVEARIKLDAYSYANLIRAHCKVGNVEEGKRVFLEMEEKGCSPNLFTYNVIIAGLCKAGLVDEALELKKSMIEKGLAPDGYTYSTLIDGFCKQKRSKEAKSLLEEMPNAGLNADQFAYTALMDGFMKEGDMEEAFRIKDEMVSSGIKLNRKTYNVIVNGLCMVGQTEKAKDLLSEMIAAEVNPDIETYTTLIKGYNREQKLDNVSELLVEMKERNLQPSLYKQEKDTTVEQITTVLKHNNWQFLLESSHLSQTLNPDVVRSVLHQNKSIDSKRLLSFFNWSTNQMVTPQNLSSFSILAVMLCNSNQFGHAQAVLEKMIETPSPVSLIVGSIVISCRHLEVCRSNHKVLDILIRVYKKKGKFNKAASVLIDAKNCDFLPSLACVNTLLKDLLKFSKMDLFWKVFDAMVEARFKLDVHSYKYLINAHFTVGNVEEGKRVFLEMEEKGCIPDIFTYNVTIGGLCKAGLVDEAVELKQSMIEKGLAPDGYTYSMLIDGFCKQKRSKEAKSLLGEMPNVDLNAYQVAYTALMDGFMKEGDIEEAFRIKDEMVSRGIKLNYITYNAIINGLCKVGQTEKAKDLMCETIAAEVNPEMKTYITLIDGYSREQKLDKAYELLVEMNERNLQPSLYLCSMKKGMPYYHELCRIFGYMPATEVHAHPSNKAPSSTGSSDPEFQFKDEVEVESTEDSKAKPKAKGKKRDSIALNQFAENGRRGAKVMEMKPHNSHSGYSGVTGNMSIGEAGLGPLAAGMKDCQAVLNATEDLDGDSYF
ncbi:hypothetical protein Vadar_033464 [Vaccinium darrowii]|uniref:Uncharacterized protein n=1 Tax=Vaccinium darrowii TaxID=229202 RepID=A0ACB7ZNH1_9ERIC|nr:hypothetical protein Vadar_033464 [Vaccinium darrowii]